jgi:hypothetical protein
VYFLLANFTEKLPYSGFAQRSFLTFPRCFATFPPSRYEKEKKNWMKQKNQFISSANTAAHGFS